MDFPYFDGEDAIGWLFCTSHYFQVYRIVDDQQLLIVAIHMEGKAFQWFQWASNNTQFHTWLKFARAVEIRFGPSKFDDTQGALIKLVQKTTMEVLTNFLTWLPKTR